MESSSDARFDSGSSSSVDPAADLELLDRAKSVVALDQFLDFGPWWYAPMLATTIGGLVLFGEAFGILGSIAVGIAAVVATCIVVVHDSRRRTVRTRPSKRSAFYTTIVVLTCWAMVAAWGTAASSLGYERFVPWYAALGWVLTTLVLLGIRAGLAAVRHRRTPLQ